MINYDINYDATDLDSAQNYMDVRTKQLLKFGYILTHTSKTDKAIINLYEKDEEIFGAIYILEQYRNIGLYMELIEQFNINKIVTLEECGISNYLKRKNIDFIEHKHTPSYKTIQRYYGFECANRSGKPYMCHIDEGGYILNMMGVSESVKDAYYLHPLTQGNVDIDYLDISDETIELAKQYAECANSYLSNMDISEFIGFQNDDVKAMLTADKLQNFKDFMTFHYGTHDRTNELYHYFNNWFELLGVDFTSELYNDLVFNGE